MGAIEKAYIKGKYGVIPDIILLKKNKKIYSVSLALHKSTPFPIPN